MADISGKFDEKFARVAETLAQSLDCGDDIGASAAVFIDGNLWSTFGAAILTVRSPGSGVGIRSFVAIRPQKL